MIQLRELCMQITIGTKRKKLIVVFCFLNQAKAYINQYLCMMKQLITHVAHSLSISEIEQGKIL